MFTKVIYSIEFYHSARFILSIGIFSQPFNETLIFKLTKSDSTRIILLCSIKGKFLICIVGLRCRIVQLAILSVHVKIWGNTQIMSSVILR